MTEEPQQTPDAGSVGDGEGAKPESQTAETPKTPKVSASPTDPKKVMEDALKAIVKKDHVEAGAASEAGGRHPAGDRPAGKRKRKRKPRSGEGQTKAGSGSAMSLAGDSMRSLSVMLKRLFDSRKVHFLRRPRYMELNLKIPVDAGRDGSRCASQLVDQVLALIQDVQKNETALAPGSVYCYFHETAEAEGCRPTELRQVFDGYGSTGRPKFTDFVTMAIERKAKGIEGLVGGDDITLTHITQGRVLRTAQLAEFGKTSPVFRVLGQVDAGLFAVRGTDSKAAFSFQVLLGKDLQGLPVLRLHPVGKCDVMDLTDQSVPQILHRFQGNLDEAALRLRGLQSNGGEPDAEEFVLPTMQILAKQLEDRARHRSRRTDHAEKRAQKSTRPTSKAYADAQNVSDDDLLWDDKESTIVVIGPHNRVHVFTPEGRHVTSLSNISRSGVQQRMRSHRWRHTEPPERGEFRMQLRAMVKSQREESERSNIEKKTRRDKPATTSEAPADPGHLQAQIAGLMSGLGGGAATPPAEPTAESPAESSAATEVPASTEIPEPSSVSTPAAESQPPAEEAAPEASEEEPAEASEQAAPEASAEAAPEASAEAAPEASEEEPAEASEEAAPEASEDESPAASEEAGSKDA